MKGQTPQPKVIIDAVKFKGATHVPRSIRGRLVTSLKQREFDGDSNWIEEFQEAVRDSWQQQGYFNAKLRAEAQIVSSDSTRHRVSVTAHIDEGRQYWLGDIRFTDATVFPPEELRKLIPLREGEVFNAHKIRDGMDALREMYGSKGYIDFVLAPLTEVDEVRQRISLMMELQEGQRIRVGRIEVLGLGQRMESLLKFELKPGDPFNPKLVNDFYKENKAVLPPDASPEDIQLHRDLQKGTVSLVFDFRTCPQPED